MAARSTSTTAQTAPVQAGRLTFRVADTLSLPRDPWDYADPTTKAARRIGFHAGSNLPFLVPPSRGPRCSKHPGGQPGSGPGQQFLASVFSSSSHSRVCWTPVSVRAVGSNLLQSEYIHNTVFLQSQQRRALRLPLAADDLLSFSAVYKQRSPS